MNQIIQRLSEVETAASSIIEEAGAKKKQMAKDQDARIAAFEKQVHEETQKKISAQQAELEKQIAEELEAQKEELEKQLAHMDRIYEESHSAIARQLRNGVVLMSGTLSYSGISAKARAMGGKLLKKEQYEQLASCASVGEAVGYLRQFSEYEPLLRDFDEHDSHRGMIEATLMGSLYNDYNRL